MNRVKFELKFFHFFNGITWIVAFLLFSITHKAKPQDIDMFNYGIESQISCNWDIEMVRVGKWILLLLCIICSISFIALFIYVNFNEVIPPPREPIPLFHFFKSCLMSFSSFNCSRTGMKSTCFCWFMDFPFGILFLINRSSASKSSSTYLISPLAYHNQYQHQQC